MLDFILLDRLLNVLVLLFDFNLVSWKEMIIKEKDYLNKLKLLFYLFFYYVFWENI